MQIPSKPGTQAYSSPIMMTPCLEAALKIHRIWTFPEVWLSLAKDLEVTTLLNIHFLQDQMASYEVEPSLLEQVSLQLVKEIRSRYAEKLKNEGGEQTPGTVTSMSDEAEQGCTNRTAQYR